MKTPIAYYGGKLSIVHHILPIIPDHEVYTEVFFGGGTVFFAKKPVLNETINDKLDIVINFYKVLKGNYRALSKLIDSTLMSRTIHREALAMLRNGQGSNVERAWAFWFCSNFSYANKIGGGIKYSNDQSVSPPRVLKNKKKEFTELLLRRIENATIENNDALIILRSRNVSKAFHYIDPPYPGADQGHYKGYDFNEFEKLLQLLEVLKGKFILSNYPSPMLDDYTKRNGWYIKEVVTRLKAPRKKSPVKHELLVANYPLNSQKLLFYDQRHTADSQH